MGKFGHLTKVYGMYRFSLSPFEQRMYAGWPKLLLNTVDAYFVKKWYLWAWVPATYMSYTYLENWHDQLIRKNPKDFENDV